MNAYPAEPSYRIGIDLGGTKIEGLVLDPDNRIAAGPVRIATPRGDYDATVATIADLVARLEQGLPTNRASGAASIGIGIPGSIVKASGAVQNANSTWLNGRTFGLDLTARLGRPVRLANDANCFALSEATDGAGAGASSVFGVILGTGCGGGIVINGRLIDGPMGISGEWGHNALPRPEADELPGRACWCGRHGCIEAWISGPALETRYFEATGVGLTTGEIAAGAKDGDAIAAQILARHTDQLARGLADVINILDPAVIVLGGGLSNLEYLYNDLPPAIARHLFTNHPRVDVRPAKWGDSSGVRGAAWLWNEA